MFFKKELYTTCDMKQYADITSVLSQNGIKYTTVMNSPTNPARYRGVPLLDNSVVNQYRILVAKKDFDKAMHCINKK